VLRLLSFTTLEYRFTFDDIAIMASGIFFILKWKIPELRFDRLLYRYSTGDSLHTLVFCSWAKKSSKRDPTS